MLCKISIIIPTYNIEKYIGECINSILNQSFQDFEIILVDDLSTDSTLDILKYYSKKDKRVRVYKNSRKKGSGGSRNYGMKKARGKYIQFVDGDDWLDSNTLESLYNYAEKYKVEMVMFKAISYDDIRKTFFKDEYLSVPLLDRYDKKIFNYKDVSKYMFRISVVPCNKLYLKSFLEKTGAKFPELYIHQDNPFFYQVFCAAQKIYFTNEYFYNRRVWKGSITTLRDDTELGTIEIVEEILKVFINNGQYENYKELLLNRLLFKLRNRFNLVGSIYKEEYYNRTKNKLKKFMFEYKLYDDIIESLDKENKKFFDKILFTESYQEYLEK